MHWCCAGGLLEGKTQQKVADELGITQRSAFALEKRALACLQELVEPTGLNKFVRDHIDLLGKLKERHAQVLRVAVSRGQDFGRNSR